MTKTYGSMRYILEQVKYDEHNWRLCGDLKVIALIAEWGILNTAAFFAYGTAAPRKISTIERCGHNELPDVLKLKISEINH